MHPTIKNALNCLLFLVFLQANGQSIDDKSLIETIKFLSTDELKGRKTGSEGNAEARDFILGQFKNIGLETHYPDYQQRFSFDNRRENTTYENAVNVVGFVAGSSSKKLIVITAHYDHIGIGKPDAAGDSIYNGADDNASGTAALIELAKYFNKNRPEHSMIFAALDGEEMGLQGAKALVKDFPFPMDQIVLNINMDMISRNEKGELYASGTYYNPSLKTILESIAAESTPKLLFGHDEPNTGPDNWTQSSDHGPFFNANVPHIYFGVEDHDDYHQPSDSFENIDQRFYINAVNLILKCTLALDAALPKE
ncbi:Zn-dependent M28 family amino/carboxypeptidase [Algoriphagus sp. 4150]|uniref:M28 family peptidase n=1 Tax=Algoriphagus sp. 4150 TaxID=2817756 RepID=UPI002856EA33|nr:M28 family peptidase [Algoriphagus sp. 4150]MDR7128549.1 Zn-dependent M28 family amino/carboxypeptidase [Algoriphagus sp. 4150]